MTDTNDRFLRGITLGRGPDEVHKRTGERFERVLDWSLNSHDEVTDAAAVP